MLSFTLVLSRNGRLLHFVKFLDAVAAAGPESWNASGCFEDAGQEKNLARSQKRSGNEGVDYETIRRHPHPARQIISLKPQLRLFPSMVYVLMHKSQNMCMLMKSESRIRSRNL